MNEFNVTLASLPADTDTPVDVAGILVTFDQEELDLLAAGQAVSMEADDAVFFITAPQQLAAIFNSRHPDLVAVRILGWDADQLRADALALAVATVGADNAHRHTFNIVAADAVPEWHGKAEPRRVRREKDDVCAWQNVTGF
jgi:hypothetical protein